MIVFLPFSYPLFRLRSTTGPAGQPQSGRKMRSRAASRSRSRRSSSSRSRFSFSSLACSCRTLRRMARRRPTNSRTRRNRRYGSRNGYEIIRQKKRRGGNRNSRKSLPVTVKKTRRKRKPPHKSRAATIKRKTSEGKSAVDGFSRSSISSSRASQRSEPVTFCKHASRC